MKLLLFLVTLAALNGQTYDIVIRGGRVIDPESGLDAVRDIGIKGSTIAAISTKPLAGARAIDAKGLVVAPGFIDLHWHGVDPASDRYELQDGVTSSLELEIGVADVDGYYRARQGKSLIHHGAAAGHPPIRMQVLGDSGDFLPADKASYGGKLLAQMVDQRKKQILINLPTAVFILETAVAQPAARTFSTQALDNEAHGQTSTPSEGSPRG